MAEIKWIKLTTDMFDNRKIKHLRRLPEGDSIVLIWIMLLTMAGRCNAGGMIFLTENIPYTPKMLANELDFEESTVLLAINSLEELDMISRANGNLAITGWKEHQNIEGLDKVREQSRLRQKAWYDKQKSLPNAEPNVRPNAKPNVRPNVRLTQPNATDIEREEEKEEEGEIRTYKAAKPTLDGILSEIENEELRQTYRDYVEMRKSIRCPMTERALRVLIHKVDSLESSIDGKCALLETAILNNWKSVYEPKDEAVRRSGETGGGSKRQAPKDGSKNPKSQAECDAMAMGFAVMSQLTEETSERR